MTEGKKNRQKYLFCGAGKTPFKFGFPRLVRAIDKAFFSGIKFLNEEACYQQHLIGFKSLPKQEFFYLVNSAILFYAARSFLFLHCLGLLRSLFPSQLGKPCDLSSTSSRFRWQPAFLFTKVIILFRYLLDIAR